MTNVLKSNFLKVFYVYESDSLYCLLDYSLQDVRSMHVLQNARKHIVSTESTSFITNI